MATVYLAHDLKHLGEGVSGTFSRSSLEGLQGEAAEQIVGAATK